VGLPSPALAGEGARRTGEGSGDSEPSSQPFPALAGEGVRRAGEGVRRTGEGPALSLEGLVRDERGVRFAPETED